MSVETYKIVNNQQSHTKTTYKSSFNYKNYKTI